MAKNSKKLSTGTILAALLYIIIGAMFIVFRSSMLGWALTVAGILAIAYGIYLSFNKQLVLGIIFAVVGVLLIVGGWVFLNIILIVFGVLLVVYGVKGLIEALQKKKKAVFPIVVSILTIVAGILFIVSKWALVDWMFIIIGAVLIIDGILALINK